MDYGKGEIKNQWEAICRVLFQLSIVCSQFFVSTNRWYCKEDSSLSPNLSLLAAVNKSIWAAKLCSNNILQLLYSMTCTVRDGHKMAVVAVAAMLNIF